MNKLVSLANPYMRDIGPSLDRTAQPREILGGTAMELYKLERI